MAHSRSQSQPVKYRYRPNAPVRAATIAPAKPINHMDRHSPQSGYLTSQLLNNSIYSLQPEALNAHSYVQGPSEIGLSHGTAFFETVDEEAYSFSAGLQPSEYTSLASPEVSPWVTSNSSIASDTCSGAWSSPASSMGFSPEPQYQTPYIDNASWPPTNQGSYLSNPCISMQDAFPAFAMDADYTANTLYYPQMAQQWQVQSLGEPALPTYESTEYCNSHDSPGSISEQASGSSETVVTIKQRSGSMMTDASTLSSTGCSEASTESPPPQRVKSQYEGELLEFSTPVAQTKSKASKSAALPCPLAAYGCTSSFISKNEWKRHINTQHLRLEAWLCDQCPKRDNKREFNRKDLFIQHLKRMHPSPCPTYNQKTQQTKLKSNRAGSRGDKAARSGKSDDLNPALLIAEQRCHIILRHAPTDSGCLFCSVNFSGRGSWEARIEHIAKHMEQYKKDGTEVPDPQTWRADRALEQWLIAEGVISKVRQRWSIA